MRDLLEQIDRGLQANLYYLSLIAALSVPDMCAALSSSDGQTNGARYAAWFDQNVAPKYNGNLDGRTCYQFRCSLLHQGTTQHPKSSYSRIIFLEPPQRYFFHNNIFDHGSDNIALNLDVLTFCRDSIASASDWLALSENTQIYKDNYPKFIQRYPNGLRPFIEGNTPIIC
jgi:hypothetical protein